MRDISRIDAILEELKIIWKEVPDLRLGQLLLNVLQDPALYYVEDADLVKYLRNFYLREETKDE